MINPRPTPSPLPAPPQKKVRPWVWAVVGLGIMVALTLAAMLFLLYAVDWNKWEKKWQGVSVSKTIDAWKDIQEAQKLKAKGRLPDAQNLYKQAIKKDPLSSNTTPHKNLLKLAVLNDSLTDLESFYGALIREHPQETSLHYYLAEVYFWAGKYQEALNVFQNLEETTKSAAPSQKSLKSVTDPAYLRINQAILYAKMEKFPEAVLKCESIKKAPASAWKAHYILGEIYAYQGDYEKALEEYRRAMPNYTWEMNPYHRTGDLYWALGRTKEAEEVFQKIMEGNPRNIKALLSLIQISLSREKYEQALNCLGSLDQEESETSAYHDLYGKTYLGLGRHSLAERHFTLALYHDPYNSEAAQGLGDSLAAQEKWEQAEAAYLKALSLNPYQRRAYSGLQKVYTKQGQTNKAKKAGLMLAKLPKIESLKEEMGKDARVVRRDLGLYGIWGGS